MHRQAVLNKLLKDSFDNYQVLFHEYKYHTHNAHHLGSLYFLGADVNKMESIYQIMCKELEGHNPSPHEITLLNWRDHLGDSRFLRSYRDFFYVQLTSRADKWREKFLEFLLDNKKITLINCIIAGVAHPLIHIGYAFELDSQIVATEALTMTAARYN